MNTFKTIHNIVSSIILAPAMRHARDEFMLLVRGYMRPTDEDGILLMRSEHAARQAIESVLLERPSGTCPHCGHLLVGDAYDKGNGGDEARDGDDALYLNYSAVCPHCGKTVYALYRFLGVYTEEEYNEIINRYRNH